MYRLIVLTIMKAKTEKIKVTVTTEEIKEIEMEISFPYYTRNEGLYCKFLSKDESIWVYEYGFKRGIEYSNGAVPGIWMTNDPTTEEEFNTKFKEVMTALIYYNNEKII